MDTQLSHSGTALYPATTTPSAPGNGPVDGGANETSRLKTVANRHSTLAWAHSDEASNDFRSDIFTKPTLPMLEAIIHTTLGDSEFEEDSTTHSLQDYVARLVGHEASLLVVTGTMGNQVALRTALAVPPPYSIVADHRGHILNLETGGVAMACGAMTKSVVPSNGRHLTLDDIKRNCTLTNTVYDCPTRVISLENPLRGTIMPLSEIAAISTWARSQTPPIHMHLDGARFWEVVAAGACKLNEIGQWFDSMQLCFSKGLGAPIGSIVTGSSTFIERAKVFRHLFGGGMRAAGIIAAPARVAIDQVFLTGKLQAAQSKAKRASALWVELGGTLQLPTETNVVVLNLASCGMTGVGFCEMGRRFDLKLMNLMEGRLIFHYQITDAAMARLCDLFRAIFKTRLSL